ncbi:MAG TPA: ATP-binding protein [Xanthomonadaceae bacterium]|nr:ATP-binding protein [Xanthomonadaceae bacterium]
MKRRLVAWFSRRVLRNLYARARAEVAEAEARLTEQLARNEAVRAELARRELFLRSLLDAAQVAIMAIDHEGRWSVFNPAAERLLGWRADEVIGRRVRYGDAAPDDAPLLVTPGQVEDTAAWLRQKLGRHVPDDWRALYALADLRQPPAESRMLHRDGREVPVLLALSAFDDAQGQRAGMIAVAADLTQIKRLEADLRDSEARAHAASQAKSAFLATMSHEIRTPMIGVTGMLEVLAHSKLEGDQRHALNVIQQSAQSLLQVVGDILDFSKIEAGRLDLVAVPTDLGRLLRGTVANFTGAASSKGLRLSATVDERVAAAHLADPMRLRQVLANCLSNAIKFTPSGSVEAALEHEGTDDDGVAERLCFRVTDTGIGIDPTRQELLFQPFAQAEGDTSRHYGGTGLGLAISRHLAGLMGGELVLDSAPGTGTTLRLRVALPRADPADVVADQALAGSKGGAIHARPLPTTAQARADGTLVLLVDDHPTNRLVIARQLALAGFASEAANEGSEGLERWRAGNYGLVLSDVHMPGLDGYALARAIRREEAETGRLRTPIVALTAAALKGEAERCLAAGMDDYLAKPVPVATLAACLQRWLPQAAPGDVAAGNESATPLPQLGQPAALDPAVLASLTGRDDATSRQLLEDFMDTTADDLAALDAARGAGDAPAIASQAHRIKGAARLVGALELAACADLLEAAAGDDDWDALLPLAADLPTAVQRLRLVIDACARDTMPP